MSTTNLMVRLEATPALTQYYLNGDDNIDVQTRAIVQMSNALLIDEYKTSLKDWVDLNNRIRGVLSAIHDLQQAVNGGVIRDISGVKWIEIRPEGNLGTTTNFNVLKSIMTKEGCIVVGGTNADNQVIDGNPALGMMVKLDSAEVWLSHLKEMLDIHQQADEKKTVERVDMRAELTQKYDFLHARMNGLHDMIMRIFS
jgi:hypothetical protein